jgi:P27 family predicted phage terminase small subunit
VDGRKPIPTHLKLLAGNPGKRKLNRREPKPRVKLPLCPAQLQGEARLEWRRTGRQLVALRVVTEADKAALAGYCLAYAVVIEASRNLYSKGTFELVPKRKGKVAQQSPYVSILNQGLKQMRAWAAELGLTPSSRTRVQTIEREEADDDLLG